MLVQDIMTRQVVAIGPDTPIADVRTLMQLRNIRHFPILEDRNGALAPEANGQAGTLIGIVSDRDIRVVGSDHPQAPVGVTTKDPVSRIMVGDVLTAHPLDPIEETAKILREHKIGAMPVLEDGDLVGIVTGTDFLDALVRMTGVFGPGSRLEVELPNRPGALAGLLARIASRNHNVQSVMTTRQDARTIGFVLRVNAIDGRGLAEVLKADGYEVLWPLDKEAHA